MLDTPPKILFCDLRLDPGESKTCMFGIYTFDIVIPKVSDMLIFLLVFVFAFSLSQIPTVRLCP